MKPFLRGFNGRRSSPFTLDLSVFSCVSLRNTFFRPISLSFHGYSWVNRVNLQSSHQQRLTEVLGARRGFGDECKCLESLVAVSEVLICSCQNPSSARQVSNPQSAINAVVLTCNPLLLSFFQVNITDHFGCGQIIIKYTDLSVVYTGRKKSFSDCTSQITLQWHVLQLVLYILIALHDAHQLLLFLFCIQWQFFSTQLQSFTKTEKEHKHARKDFCFYIFRSW